MQFKPRTILLFVILIAVSIFTGSTAWAQTNPNPIFLPIMVGGSEIAVFSPNLPLPPAPQEAPVVIHRIENAPDGNFQLEEFVQILNMSGEDIDLSSWNLVDNDGNDYNFPDYVLPANGIVNVWSGPGRNTDLDLYWGADDDIWDNSGGECAHLSDSSGEKIDSQCYP
jgi:hypothetical protein